MNKLETLINNYRPSDEAINLVNQLRVVLLAGISGAGKDTIMNRLLDSGSYYRIVTHTTRPPRSDDGHMEIDGIDYHFIDDKEAMSMLKNHEFIEAKFVHGNTVYGTSIGEFQRAKDDDKVAIASIDVQGVSEFMKISPKILPIFIIPPSYEIWLERLKGRYSSENEFESAWPKRRDSAIKEITTALANESYRFVINDDLDEAIINTGLIIADNMDPNQQKTAANIAKKILDKLKSNNS